METNTKQKIVTSKELAEAMNKKHVTVFSQGAFRDDPGNSVVFAAPQAPGLRLGDVSTGIENMSISVSYIQVTGEYHSVSVAKRYGIVTRGEGIVTSVGSSKKIEVGDVFVAPFIHKIQAGNGGVSFTSLEIAEEEVGANALIANKTLHALRAKFCSVLPESTERIYEYGAIAQNGPRILVSSLVDIAGIPSEDMLVALNSVFITGATPEKEPLHHHKSNIAAIIYSGGGILMEPCGIRIAAKEGDGLVVPVNAKHYFEAPHGHMAYCGIEFGKTGSDYQKHYNE